MFFEEIPDERKISKTEFSNSATEVVTASAETGEQVKKSPCR